LLSFTTSLDETRMEQKSQEQPAWPDFRNSGKESLQDLQAMFIQNVEHELRTPLAIMQGYAELLRDGELGDLAPEQQKAVFVIVDRALELRTLVNRIDTLMEVQSRGGIMLPVSLADVAAEVVNARLNAATQAGLTLETRIDSDVPLISGNPHQLYSAMDCLVENAIKFTPFGGRVTVEVYAEPDRVCFAVKDTGVGIPEDKLAHLFNGFYQVDGSTKRRYGGIGLGLTVAKAVVELHGGQISVESHFGQGSQFTIRLPVSSPGAQVGRQDASAALRRILVVDDEENVALTLQAGLEKLPNCHVEIATSGEQAWQLFEQQPFHLLITDYKMPGMDGIALAARVRQAYPQTAIVMVTAYSTDELREQAAQAAIQHILDKPIKLAQVRSAAIEALSQPDAQPEESSGSSAP